MLNVGAQGGQFIFDDFTSHDTLPMTISVNDALAAITDGSLGLANIAPAEVHTVNLVFDHDDNPATPSVVKSSFLDIVNDDPNYDGSGRTDLRFGQGPDGTLYLLNKRNGHIYTAAPIMAAGVPGDTNGDGNVDLDDYLNIAARIGGPPVAPGSIGDVFVDGIVDLKDFGVWQQNRTDLQAASRPTPEPSAWVIAGLGLCCMLSTRTAGIRLFRRGEPHCVACRRPGNAGEARRAAERAGPEEPSAGPT